MRRFIDTLLIANRGEIARRIIRTAHAMGTSTVAIYAPADAEEPYVREADLAVALTGSGALETYLDQAQVLSAARRSGADALHPGYGFLAENAEFAQSVLEAGLVWVGPPPKAIAAMGEKLSAKRLMDAAGVANLPSVTLGPGVDLHSGAEAIGYPLLVKASAGGGGKGMRIVDTPSKLESAIAGARREAAAAFGDDTVFLEKWLEGARHVEVQVIADQHGNVVHAFERECSIQRRHQKIIEEAPCSAVSETTRRRLGEAAIAAAKAVHYTSVGTVEFLYRDDEFWFLEMNTRLQVEHPVTEAITGLDLVREQLRIAGGAPLAYHQSDLKIEGHAIEARLYAEDPVNDFLPTTGPVLNWTPAQLVGTRYDSGIETGSRVGIDFDPLLAKVIAHAPTREEAASRLARALAATRIQGLITNREFLVETLRTPAFLAGETTTDFIDTIAPPRRRALSDAVVHDSLIAISMLKQCDARARAQVLTTFPSGWRNTPMPPECVAFQCRDETITVEYRANRDGSFRCRIGGTLKVTRILSRQADNIALEIDGKREDFQLAHENGRWWIHSSRHTLDVTELARFPSATAAETSGALSAPMPGKVVSTHVQAGDSVHRGQLLLILEAMKMEHRVCAPRDGVIEQVRVRATQQVANGELLVVLTDN